MMYIYLKRSFNEINLMICSGLKILNKKYRYNNIINVFMSKQLKKSLKVVNLYQSNNKSIGQRYPKPNIKTIEIFMKDIDKQLELSYIKLKQSKHKQSHIKKISILQGQTLPYEEISMEENFNSGMSSPQCKYNNFSTTNQPEKENITLISNRDVMEYINLVYQLYSIKDPMKQTDNHHKQPAQVRPLAEKNYSTNKKIKDLKDNFQKTIGSASTLKHSYNFHQIQLNPFKNIADKPLLNSSKNRSSFGTKLEVISLHSKNNSQAINDANYKSNNKSNFNRTNIIKNSNGIPIKKKLTIKQSICTRKNSFQNDNNKFVPQLFRYCFMCEQPILQSNLVNHEYTCLSLKNALNNQQMPQIIHLLDEKINRLKNEINGGLIFKDQKQISKDFLNIKSSVKNWMNKLPLDNISKSHEQEWRKEFNKISQSINKSVCKTFQSINKLQWFSRLKDNISNRYMIKC